MLTAQLCRHWEVATERLEELVKDFVATHQSKKMFFSLDSLL